MAAESPGFLQASSYGAATFRQMFSSLFGAPLPGSLSIGSIGGVVNTSDLATTQNGTPNMSVNIAGGQMWIPGTTSSNQAMYYDLNDATVNLAIAASNPSNPRIDVPCGTINDAAYSGASKNCTLQVITGTAAASPVAPSVPASSLALSNVAVAANATTIVTANITDKRSYVTGGGGQKIANNSDSGWIAASGFANSWVASSGTPVTGAYYRKQGNRVDLRGAITGGTSGAYAFTLPAGYTPTANRVFCTQSYGSAYPTYLAVGSNGNITPSYQSGGNTCLLDGVTFEID